jgi:pimeloyl-ACP methyl ester carboxylesterase
MGEYVDINGHPTWVDERGSGSGSDTVLMLHGGLSNSDLLLDTIGAALAERYRVVAFDRRGHGRTADTDAPFHYDDMATETIGVLEQVVGGPAHLVGWSDGGIISLYVALRRADLVGKLVPIGANYHFNGLQPIELDPSSPVMAMIADSYGRVSPDGPSHFPDVVNKSLTMFGSEPAMTTDDLKGIAAPVLVLAGDDDAARLDHTCALYEALPAGELAIVPGTSHALPLEKPAEVIRLVLDFLAAAGPPQTFMPMLRQPTTA